MEIPKVREGDGSHLSDWLKFFAARSEEEFMSVSEKSPVIAEAWGVIKTLSADEKARLIAESMEKARMDYEDNWDGAYRDGEQKGRLEGRLEGEQKGRLEGRLEIARNALRKKLPVETISELTGLTASEIERIAGEL